jgi:hypothetical protein
MRGFSINESNEAVDRGKKREREMTVKKKEEK